MDGTWLLPGWYISADQTYRLNQNLEMRSKSLEQVLDDAFLDIIWDIAILEPDPLDWEGWFLIFLEHLNVEACQRKKIDSYLEMVNTLIINLSGKDKNKPSQTI